MIQLKLLIGLAVLRLVFQGVAETVHYIQPAITADSVVFELTWTLVILCALVIGNNANKYANPS